MIKRITYNRNICGHNFYFNSELNQNVNDGTDR
jgi:hypothetical protein